MIELILIALAITETARTARGRGAPPVLFASTSLTGWLILEFGAGYLRRVLLESVTPRGGIAMTLEIASMVAAWVWVGGAYLYVRFVAGRRHVQAHGRWTCPDCRWLNPAKIFKCEACGWEHGMARAAEAIPVVAQAVAAPGPHIEQRFSPARFSDESDVNVARAGFWRRTAAYLIDVVPITVVIASTCYWFFGLDEAWRGRWAVSHDTSAGLRFIQYQGVIRDSTFLVWLVYCTVLEASPLRGTIGKAVMHLAVVGPDGERLTLARSGSRNAAKILSYLPLAIGFLWVAFSKQKAAWHDKIARTSVVRLQPKRCIAGAIDSSAPRDFARV